MSAEYKYVIEKTPVRILKKTAFFFANHKVSPLCWALFKKEHGLCDAVTFDSHRDFREGTITAGDIGKMTGPLETHFFGCKRVSHLRHFSENKEFVEWDPLNEEENKKLIQEEHKFFDMLSDNHIDVAFLKNLVKDVHLYYLNQSPGQGRDAFPCEDVDGNIHNFDFKKIAEFSPPPGKFIFDLDFDFFTKEDYNDERDPLKLIPDEEIKENFALLKEIFENQNCVGGTIALEPACCGGVENCKRIGQHFSKIFKVDANETIIQLLNSSNSWEW